MMTARTIAYGNAGRMFAITPGDKVDLHMHSPVSDGFWTAETLPPAAAELGIKVLALTDHDEIAGIAAMAAACRAQGIYLITGSELSTTFRNVGYHMLAYGFDPASSDLAGYIERGRRYYEDMVNNAIAELAKQGKKLDRAKSVHLSNRPLKVYHLVMALVEQNFAKNYSEAYALCNKVGAHYGWTLPMEEAISLAHGAGGVAVIAHPGRAEPGFTAASAEALDGMRAAGLDGVEAFHSYHSPNDQAFYSAYADEYHMLVSCGSDTHGPGQSRRMLTPWPATLCRELLDACGVMMVSNA